MCLLEMAFKISTDEQKVKVDVSIGQQLQTLESLLDNSLQKPFFLIVYPHQLSF